MDEEFKCQQCGEPANPSAVFCKICGSVLEQSSGKPPGKPPLWRTGLMIFAVLLLLFIASLLIRIPEKESASSDSPGATSIGPSSSPPATPVHYYTSRPSRYYAPADSLPSQQPPDISTSPTSELPPTGSPSVQATSQHGMESFQPFSNQSPSNPPPGPGESIPPAGPSSTSTTLDEQTH